MKTSAKDAALKASADWKAYFNAGDAAGCASCYEEDAIMVAKPFGTFKGRAEIEAFWTNLITDGFTDVEYINPNIEPLDDKSAVLTSKWKMNKAHGVITRELWVLQSVLPEAGNQEVTALLREDHFEALG